MRISDWSSDVCSSDLGLPRRLRLLAMTNLTGRTSLGPARVDRGFHRQPDAQRMRFQLLRIERDAHRQALDDFHPVARRILRWDQREGGAGAAGDADHLARSDEHTSELQSLMRNSDAVSRVQKKKRLTIEYTLTLP